MQKYLLTLFAFLLASPAAHADWIADYFSYRSSADLGQLVIESGRIRGKYNVLRAQKSRDKLAKKNIFVGSSGSDQSYRRIAKVGAHSIDCTITVHPPLGHGYGGSNYTADLLAIIDGKKKIQCSLGYLAQKNNLHVEKVVIYPEDRFIEVAATAGDRNIHVNPPAKHCLFSDPHVISNESLIYSSSLSMR